VTVVSGDAGSDLYVGAVACEPSTDGRSAGAIVTGTFRGQLTFPATPTLLLPTGRTDSQAFLARYSFSDGWQWSLGLGGLGYDLGAAVVIGPSGNLFALVETQETTDLSFGQPAGSPKGRVSGPAPIPKRNGVVIASYTPTGTHRWAQLLQVRGDTPPFTVHAGAISLDSSRGILTAGGRFSSDFLDVDATRSLTGDGVQRGDSWVAELDAATGALGWAGVLGGQGASGLFGIAGDQPSRGVFVAGSFVGAARFADRDATSTNRSSDGFVALLFPPF
jgi:hypothetical protein